MWAVNKEKGEDYGLVSTDEFTQNCIIELYYCVFYKIKFHYFLPPNNFLAVNESM